MSTELSTLSVLSHIENIVTYMVETIISGYSKTL